jgi:uncharacterized protein (TIGR03437 family)
MKLALLLFPAILCGQTFIDSVTHPGGLAPGGFAEIDGAFFDEAATVTVGGLAAAVYPVGGGYHRCEGCEVYVFIQIPSGIAIGPTVLVLTQGKNNVSWPITIVPAAPQFVSTAGYPYALTFYPPDLRIERNLAGGGFGPWSCAASDTPKPGDLVRVYMTGLGATNPQVSTGTPAPESPLATTVVPPRVLFGKSVAEVRESVLAPGQVGVYRVTFMLPDDFGFQSLSITAGGITVETPLAIGNATVPLYPSAAPSSIQVATACGARFLNAAQTLTANPKNPQDTLGDIRIQVSDSQGPKPAAILSATPDRIEYVLPEGTLPGTANLNIMVGAASWRGTIDVKSYAPRVLEVSPKITAAYVVRVRDGVQTVEPTFRVTDDGKFEAIPIDLGPVGDSVYLCVFGTGWRARNPGYDLFLEYSRGDGSYLSVPATYAGAQGEYAGMDQADFLLPRSLAGSGNLYLLRTFLDIGGARTGFAGWIYK